MCEEFVCASKCTGLMALPSSMNYGLIALGACERTGKHCLNLQKFLDGTIALAWKE
jgi:hypothetical protein